MVALQEPNAYLQAKIKLQKIMLKPPTYLIMQVANA